MMRRLGRSPRGVFMAVAMGHAAVCCLLLALHLSQAIWLVNLPATITVGRLGSLLGGELAGLAVTVLAGSALYGWACSRLARPRRSRIG
jgi:hypothetical protein